MNCKKCGTKINMKEKYCTNCGDKTIVEYMFNDPTNGGKSIITINKGSLTISRPGVISKLSHGFTGEKTVMFEQIASVQIKKAGFSRGYIQFTMAGSREAKSGAIFGEHDNENIVYFMAGTPSQNKKNNDNAEEIKKAVEEYNLNIKNSTTNIIKEDDKYDKLAKLKALLDDGVISTDEFEVEKKKLLND